MILDTSFLLDLLRGDPGARDFLEKAESSSEALRIAPPALAKLAEGIERARNRPRAIEQLHVVLAEATHAPFGAEHAWRAGALLADAARAGAPLDPFDAMTAAIALVEEEPLVTRNARDYERIAGLVLRTY